MKNSSIVKEFDSSLVGGVSQFEQNQIDNFNFQQSARLRQDLTYVVAPQWVHDEKLARPINGNDRSRKIFAVGVDANGNPVQMVSLSVNGLRLRHYGKVNDNPTLKIKAAANEQKLFRAVDAIQTSVFKEGNLPIATSDKKAYIKRDFAFKVNDRYAVFVPDGFTKKGNGYDMDHYQEDGKEYVKLGKQTVNEYSEVLGAPVVDWDNIIEDNHKELFDNIPQ